MEREKLRIDNGIREIEVNDNGDCICIPIDDNAFFERARNFLDWIEKQKDALEKELENRPKQNHETTETGIADIDVIEMQTRLSEEICKELDKLLGEGCCRKVFIGIQSPSIVLIFDFLDQLIPILQKFAGERNEKINYKYSKNRKGANTKKR